MKRPRWAVARVQARRNVLFLTIFGFTTCELSVKRHGPDVRHRAISLISAAGLLLAGGLAASSQANAAAPNDTNPDTAGRNLSDNMRSPMTRIRGGSTMTAMGPRATTSAAIILGGTA